MRARLIALVLAFGCNSSGPHTSSPPPAPEPPKAASVEPAPPPASSSKPPAPGLTPPAGCTAGEAGKTITREQCSCLGGRVSPSRGGVQERCGPGEAEVGAIRLGIEGGWCCKAR